MSDKSTLQAMGGLGLVIVLSVAGCGGDAAGDGDSSSGESPNIVGPASEAAGDTVKRVSADGCVDKEGRDVCAALEEEQVLVGAMASGKRAEIYNQPGGGDAFNTQGYEEKLVTSSNALDVVCFQGTLDAGEGDFGILLDRDLVVSAARAQAYSTGKVSGTNFKVIAFIDYSGVNDPDTVSAQLAKKLKARFKGVDDYMSCNDPRVILNPTAAQAFKEKME